MYCIKNGSQRKPIDLGSSIQSGYPGCSCPEKGIGVRKASGVIDADLLAR